MLKKIISKLRSVIAPSSAKKKETESSPKGRGHTTKGQGQGPRPPRAAGENAASGRDREQGARGGGRREGRGVEGRQGGEARQGGGRGRGRESHGAERREERRGGGAGGNAGGGRHARLEKHEKPRTDHSYEHPRKEPIKPVSPVTIPPQDTNFTKLGLNDAIAFAVAEMGYNDPTPIQAQAVPVVLSGRDVIGSAQTGTGKTAAFALPIIHRLGAHAKKTRCLVLEPTRELALQVEEAIQKYAKYTDITVTVVYGGVGYGKQREDLARGVDVIAATPGRLLDHLEQGTASLDGVEILVLDEVDRMLDMGFLPDVQRIIAKCPKARQTLFFSATMPPELAQLASWALREPQEIKIGRTRSAAETVAHAFYPVVGTQKFDLLLELLKRTDFKSVIIFTRTKMGADRIAHRLQLESHTVGVIHSDRSQRERVEALQGFKDGTFEVLVATDIAARGLDIAGVSHVVNYDVPENAEDYVHRIGRTGRAQSTGDAYTLVTEEDVRDARSIERFIGASIERKKLEDFPYIYSALFDETALAQAEAAAPKPAGRLMRGTRGGRR